MDRLRRTLKSSISMTRYAGCCQAALDQMADEMVDQAINTILHVLPEGRTSSLASQVSARSTIVEQDETECDTPTDNTLVDDPWTTNLDIWKECRTYELVQVRQKQEHTFYAIFQNNMKWLDDVLAIAKTKFGAHDVIPSLPKTPAVKRKKAIVAQASSPVLADSGPIEKPSAGRPRRTAARKAKERIASYAENGEASSGRRMTRQQAKASVSATPAETGSVPKKIARFSRLPHVKDKVDAFEQYTDGTPRALTSISSATPVSNKMSTPPFNSTYSATPLTATSSCTPSTPQTVTRVAYNSPVTVTAPPATDVVKTVETTAMSSDVAADTILNQASPNLKSSRKRSSPNKAQAKRRKTKSSERQPSKTDNSSNANSGLSGTIRSPVAADVVEDETAAIPAPSPEVVNMSCEDHNSLEDSVFVHEAKQESPVLSVEKPATNSTRSRSSNRHKKSDAPADDVAQPAASPVGETEPPPKSQAPQRMTRSKMRAVQPPLPINDAAVNATSPEAKDAKQAAAPSRSESKERRKSPVRSKAVVRTKSPARVEVHKQTEGKTRMSSTERSKLPTSESGKKKKLSSNISSSNNMSRASSESNLYTSSSIVRTLTKAASASGLSKPSSAILSKHHTVSTPDMSRTQSFVKNMIRGTPRTSPQNTPSFSRTVVSFLKRATPQKTLTKEEEAERKELKLREKEEMERQRREKAEKLKHQQVEAKRRERAERMKKAQEARQAKRQELKTKQMEIEKKTQQKSEVTQQAHEKKLKEDREKALAREQKLQEVEERRKREEERKLQKLKASEAEQKRHAAALVRKKEYEEVERLKKQEAERNRLLKKTAEDRNAGKLAALSQTASSCKPASKTSIYEVIANKSAALAEEKNAFIKAAKENVSRSASANLNSTFTKDNYQPCNNYIDIHLTEAEDEFEDPKFSKCVKPSWAQGHKLNTAVINQYTAIKSGRQQPADVLGVFHRYTPDLTKVFPIHKPIFFKRTSSAIWSSPPIKHKRV